MKENLNSHYFHAEAHALTGKLTKPFEEQIKKQAFVKLEGQSQHLLLESNGEKLEEIEAIRKLREKRAQENYFSQHAKNFRLEGIISYTAAHTQVSGHRSKKNPQAFVTLATSVVENLNILNVVTADKVVGQISTTHFPGQYSPHVTFLGTHFENLRIARHKCEPALKLAFAGARPDGKEAIYPAKGTGLIASLEKQYQGLREKLEEFKSRLQPEHVARLNADDSWLSRQYHKFADFKGEELPQIPRESAGKDAKAVNGNDGRRDSVTCSLVEHVEIEDIVIPVKGEDPKDPPPPIVYHPPAHCFGHVIHVPDFGTIFLAELKVNHNSFHLTMIRLELGCIADGSASIATCNVNGGGKGSGGS